MNRPRGGGRASALLQKVSTQLKGERVPTVPKEEDELNAYLSTLSKKTSQQAKSINFSDFGDISISSSDNLSTPKQKSPEIGAGSKFLKKKKPPEPISDEDESSIQVRKKKTITQNASNLLNKAAGLTKKEQVPRQTSLLANQNVFSIDSDSDSEKVRLSRLDTPTDMSVGHDGRKFMKRPETPKATKETVKKTNKSLKGSKEKNKKVTSALTSEEESLADFMQRLSSSDSTPRPRSPNKFLKRPVEGAPPIPRSPSPESKPFRYTPSPRSPKRSPIIGRRTPSPLHLHSRSQDSDMVDSITSEVADTQDTSSSNDLLKDVMDINALEPAIPDTKKASSKEKKHSFKKEKPKKEKKMADSDIFFGLQSVDDLMGRISDEEESIASEISEIHTGRGYTPTPRKDSLTGIQTFGSKPSTRKQISLSQDYDDSISERIGISSKYDKSSMASEVRTQYSEDTAGDYTEGFESDTESITETYSDRVHQTKAKSRPVKDVDRSYSESYTSYSDSKTFSKSLRQPEKTSKHRPPTRNIQVQTGEEPGLSYSWKTPYATVGPQYGLDFVDPSPIATHVISADALETMTAYSPAMIALHDMLKQQLLLTQSFLSAQQRIYSNYQSSLETNYHYTTLEDTKEYIKQHRKKPITFKEAYKMVSAEMDS
ncbi:hypothetical protein LOTGIDRAFT_233142 [Lottia gigantea]|uniref:DUF4614 domain-containing protein n=1 Tax=Lottia gigantea TaxID=225164 RepID=V4BTU6_LOTGI|nr:hypothetical protein LOTGIDRAFT_233142 [Lottia gigantea]ESO92379.1 hypothetical protein LOTGIDRAFT_233142 [Lottia gigantea]